MKAARNSRTSPGMLTTLDALLTMELTASHLYLFQSRCCDNWGYTKLAEKLLEESGEEQGHAVLVMDRQLFLGARPGMRRMTELPGGASVEEFLRDGLAFETKVLTAYAKAIRRATDEDDAGTRLVLEKIQKDTDGHVNWLDGEIHRLQEMGLGNYLVRWV